MSIAPDNSHSGNSNSGNSAATSNTAETPPMMNRMEPVLNVGKQCAVYLAVVAALAGGVAFFGPFERMPAVAQEQTIIPLEGEFDMMVPLGSEDDAAPKNVAVFYVTGAPAQKMWEAFPMQPVEDECVGRLSKYGNGMVC